MKYSHWLAILFSKIFNHGEPYAVTIGQTAYFSVPKEEVLKHPKWVIHENIHKAQWRRLGWKFLPLYLWYQVRYGYDKNPLEIEARKG